ncbi:hypothetical protein ACFQO7_21575 [Catellatospora aurea]|uniref:Uncharacterized protein n=1 Tax=Catellatospora aurea TaxID=1337874 RepID=A0ABW2H398_9ACTN
MFGRAKPSPLPYPQASPQGLAARWLRWAASIPAWRTPLGDRAEYYATNQPKDVWFLAGQFGDAGDDPENFRRVTVPAGRPIFLPIWWAYGTDDAPQGRPTDAGIAYATLENDEEIDLPILEVVCRRKFTVDGVFGNPITTTGRSRDVWMWANCVLLTGLTPGRHRLITSRAHVSEERPDAAAFVYLITIRG